MQSVSHMTEPEFQPDEYLHFYYFEICPDNSIAILALVEEMFKRMAQMGDVWYMRAAPEISHNIAFDGTKTAHVFCRFSSKRPVPKPMPEMLGLGRLYND
jgi:hypothetical protein